MFDYNDPNRFVYQGGHDGASNYVRLSDNKTATWQNEGEGNGYFLSPEGKRLEAMRNSDGDISYYYEPKPIETPAPVAAPAPDYRALASQFAGGILNQKTIGVPQVTLGCNYAQMYSMPVASSQPFASIGNNYGGLLNGSFPSGTGYGTIGSAQPFAAAMAGSLLGGK
jgi:hypothetical protein